MSLLLDTHALLWWLSGELSEEVTDRLADPSTYVAVSSVSIWEVEIKRSLGKLDAPAGLAEVVVDEGFEQLPVTFAHAERAGGLPLHHRDPFDRMLVAQSELEGLTVVTRDAAFELYGIRRLTC